MARFAERAAEAGVDDRNHLLVSQPTHPTQPTSRTDTISLQSDFLERDYVLEKHASDVFDQFQLHYLALDDFTLVTRDRRIRSRTAGSPQTSRIMSFEDFQRSL